MTMRKPPHHGRQIKTALQAADLNITEGAAHLGGTRNTLSRVINGLAGFSPEMAIRLAKAFGGKADICVRMQASSETICKLLTNNGIDQAISFAQCWRRWQGTRSICESVFASRSLSSDVREDLS